MEEENKITLIDKNSLIKKVGKKFSQYVVQIEGSYTEDFYFIHVTYLDGYWFFNQVFYNEDSQICFNSFKDFARRNPELQYRVINLSNSNAKFQQKIYDWLVNMGYDVILTNERFVDEQEIEP